MTPPAVVISTLPSVTITDLAALTVISPFILTFCGERLLQSCESIIQSCHPNHWLWVDPAGNIRVFDQRATTNYTVTLGKPVSAGAEPDGTYGDRWMMPQLHRDLSDTYSRLIVRGDTDVSAITLSVEPTAATGTIVYNSALTGGVNVNTGGLYPDFAWGSYTDSASAAAAYDPNSFHTQSLQGGQDQGSCTCSSTTQVDIQSFNTSLVLTSDQLDQTTSGLHAILTVTQAFGSGIAQMFSTSVIANTSTTSGASTLTVSPPLPATTYTSYFLTFSSQSGNVVYRRYIATQSGVGARLQNYFPYPFALKNADGTAATLTSAATGMVLWSATGSAPYQESDFSITVDPESGTISFPRPTCLVYGGGLVTPPSDVRAFVPIALGDLTVHSPSSGYAGTLYTVEGVSRTKTITLRDWTQFGTNANIQTFCDEQFDSIKDVVVEGSINYLGLATTYLTPGASVSITGNGYTTGWETLQTSPMPAGLPVASVDVTFNWGGHGSSYITTLHVTNRKQKYTGEIFVRPPTTGQALGGSFGAGYEEGWGKGMAGMLGYQRGEAADLTGTIGGMGDDVSGAIGGLGDDVRSGISGLAKTGLGVPAAFGIGQDGAASGGQDEAVPLLGLDQIDGGGGGGGGGKKRQRVAMPTHPEAGLGKPEWPAPGPNEHISGPGAAPATAAPRATSSTYYPEENLAQSWTAPSESWDAPAARAGKSIEDTKAAAPDEYVPATPSTSNRGNPAWGTATSSDSDVGESISVTEHPPSRDTPIPSAAKSPAANDPQGDLAFYPPGYQPPGSGAQADDEATKVMEAERRAAQQAGGSVTGKPYVPTLDEALDNPINRSKPTAADLDRIEKESRETPEAKAATANNAAIIKKMRAEGLNPL